MVANLTEEFKTKLLEGLYPLQTSLIAALKQIIEHRYPPEVVAVAFEVFPDTWSRRFPARAFFLDGSNNEHFIYVNGEATYPSPIDPGILDAPHIITSEYENSILARDPTLDTVSIGADEFIAWFALCWGKAGGTRFRLHATIADHDSDRELNLSNGQWQDRYAAF